LIPDIPTSGHGAQALWASDEELFFEKMAKQGISFLTLGKCGLISNFGVNFPHMSASSELEPHPRCPRVGCSQLTACPVPEVLGPGAEGLPMAGRRLEVRADAMAMGGFTTG